MFQVKLTRQALKSFEQLWKSQPKMASRIANAIDFLSKSPDSGIPLKGVLKGLSKYRVGAYRIIYQVKHSLLLITIIDIGHRKDIYR